MHTKTQVRVRIPFSVTIYSKRLKRSEHITSIGMYSSDVAVGATSAESSSVDAHLLDLVYASEDG